jgi:hypothetical protein
LHQKTQWYKARKPLNHHTPYHGKITIRQFLFSFQVVVHFSHVQGWGAWIRTKIHRSKVWCAAIAPRPNEGIRLPCRGILPKNSEYSKQAAFIFQSEFLRAPCSAKSPEKY